MKIRNLFLAAVLVLAGAAQAQTISALTAASALGGTELFECVQTGSKKCTAAQIRAYAVPFTTGGDLLYGGASGVPTRLANGTAGQVLTSAGTTVAPTWTSITTLNKGLNADAQSLAAGVNALVTTTAGYYNVMYGYGTGQFIQDGTENTAVGGYALNHVVGGSKNTAIGSQALYAITAGQSNNTAVGAAALLGATSSGNNTAVGTEALKTITSGQSNNTAVGMQAMMNSASGTYNIALGASAGRNMAGTYNIAIGGDTPLYTNSGSYNVAIGRSAIGASASSTGSNNVAIGDAALGNNTSGHDNVAVGYAASGGSITNRNTTGYNNIWIGKNSVGSAVGNNNEIVIGAGAVGLGTGTTVIGTSGTTTATTIYGTMTAGSTISDSKGDVRILPQNSQSAAYTTVLLDSGKHILHPSADTTARTFTIAANASVAYPIGTMLTIVNQDSAGVLTVAITSDTMRLAGAGTTGSRTMAANCVATALKITATEWIISGGSCLTFNDVGLPFFAANDEVYAKAA